MQEQLNNLYTLVSQLLNNLLNEWAGELTQPEAPQNDGHKLTLLQALLSIRAALAPLLDAQQDAHHG